MNQKIKDKIDRLIKVTEEFGFDVGMHNKCFDDAIKKRLEKFGEDSEEFTTHILALLETRIRYLKEKSKWWYRDRPEHVNNIIKWKEIIENKENLEQFLNADLGTILAITRPGRFSGRDYALKTLKSWVEIVNIKTNQEIFNAKLTGKTWDIEKELLPRFNAISMVYEGFDGIHPRHITDLKALSIGTVVETPTHTYTKILDEKWSPGDNELIPDNAFIKILSDKKVKVVR